MQEAFKRYRFHIFLDCLALRIRLKRNKKVSNGFGPTVNLNPVESVLFFWKWIVLFRKLVRQFSFQKSLYSLEFGYLSDLGLRKKSQVKTQVHSSICIVPSQLL
ncbi:hypothetical protein Ahy_B06g085245 isoform A [Arachis hypogaea]|uniref:Uncharacterized protein n=1 Tax=Arachis hypogaea TaxID=3818 RepID=A0A444YU03_ARAHY|nr:hypothetical protein Ahy_B06g085245 isoform A [Arachis hypogaea]